MKKAQVSIVSRSNDGWHVQQIADSLTKYGISSSIIDFDNSANFSVEMKKLSEVTIWRASSLRLDVQRSSVSAYLDKTFMINEAVFIQPGTSQKFYQQQTLLADNSLKKYAIPTYRVPNKNKLSILINKNELKFPVIAKPHNGSRGQGIIILHSISDVDDIELPIGSYVMQQYIPNAGDWRVLVIGGRAVGAIKRVAQDGAFLNNVSRGASSHIETDEAILKELYKIATKTAALFRMRFCGVDIIRDESDDQLHVLELNTAPQWAGEYGFQATTGLVVSDEIAKYVSSIMDRKIVKSTSELVDNYYKANINNTKSEYFHYASRLWLWAKDTWARDALDDLRGWYIGYNEAEYRSVITQILERTKSQSVVNKDNRKRAPYFQRYKMLSAYNSLLFKVIFSESVYGIDLRPYVKQYVSDKQFLDLFFELSKDHEAMCFLSTHAINYLYLLKNYFKKQTSMASMVLIDPIDFIEISKGYDDLVSSGRLSKKDAIKLEIYMLTHAIIGESRFYQRKVNTANYKILCKHLEEIISNNYFDVSLDNKFEFLVCAKICSYTSNIRTLILQEAEKSMSWAGNFLVDQDASAIRHCLRTSEHRNVLYVMATRLFATKSKSKAKKTSERNAIGRLARVSLPEYGLERLVARVDTGATRSSVCVCDVRQESGKLYYKMLYPEHPLYTGKECSSADYKTLSVKNPGKEKDIRYAVMVELNVEGNHKKVLCSLSDRKHMLYPLLLGRDFLKGSYYVDIDRQFVRNLKPKATNI